MKVFITGGSGYLGAHLVQRLAEEGHALSVLTRSEARARELAPYARVHLGALQDVDAIEGWLRGHDALIHNAIVWDDAPEGARPELELEDTRLAIKLFEAAAKAGIPRVLMTSSVAVHRPFARAMDESSALHPVDTYGAIKASNELFLSALAAMHGMTHHIVRVAPVIGPPAYEGAAFKCDPRFVGFFERAARGEDIVVQRDDGRQFIGARDVARTYAALLHTEHARGTWICASQSMTTWASIAEGIVHRMRSTSRVLEVGEAPPHDFKTTKLERLGLRFEAQPVLDAHLDFLLRAR